MSLEGDFNSGKKEPGEVGGSGASGDGSARNPYNYQGWINNGHDAGNYANYSYEAGRNLTNLNNSDKRGGPGHEYQGSVGSEQPASVGSANPWSMGQSAQPAASSGYPAMANSYGLGAQPAQAAPAPQFDYSGQQLGKDPGAQSSHGANPWSIGSGEAGARI